MGNKDTTGVHGDIYALRLLKVVLGSGLLMDIINA